MQNAKLPALLAYLTERERILVERIKATDHKTRLAEYLAADLEITRLAKENAILETQIDTRQLDLASVRIPNVVLGRSDITHITATGPVLERFVPVPGATLGDLRSQGEVAALLADRAESRYGDDLPNIYSFNTPGTLFPLDERFTTIAEVLDFTGLVIERQRRMSVK